MKIEAGAHPKEIQEEAGHSSYSTTMNIYGHLFESRGEKTAEAMDEMYRAALTAPAPPNRSRIAYASHPAKITRNHARSPEIPANPRHLR